MADAVAIVGLQRFWRNGLLILVFALGAWAWGSGLLPTMLDQWDDIVYLGKQHIELVAISGGLAIAVGIPLGVLLTRTRFRRYGDAALQVLNIGATVPTLAVLALSMSFLGIGNVPAVFGLFIATILPIVSNTLVTWPMALTWTCLRPGFP